jgi:hypothetical protein
MEEAIPYPQSSLEEVIASPEEAICLYLKISRKSSLGEAR